MIYPKCGLRNRFYQNKIRSNFLLRLLRFYTYINFFIIFIWLLISFDDRDFLDECEKRKDCYTFCNNDYFPNLLCEETTNTSFKYNGNTYSRFYNYLKPSTNQSDYERCKGYIDDNPNYEYIDHKNRQARLHTCFKYCNDNTIGFTSDNRVSCTGLSQTDQDKMLCLYPEEDCEFTTLDSEYTLFGSGKDAVSFSPLVALIAMLIIMPIKFLFELWCIFLARQKLDKTLKSSSKIMMYQIFTTALFCTLAIMALHFLVIEHLYGRPALFWVTIIFSLIIDQLTMLVVLMAIWFSLIKRCGYLGENEAEYDELDDEDSIKSEQFIPRLKMFCLKILESSYFENTSLFLISLYTFFIFYWLTLSDFFPQITTSTLAIIDIIFTSLFLAEILMKTFASNFRYLFDKFNAFDAVIVVVGFILNLVGIVAKGLGVLRLIRVGVIIVRKITGNEHKLRHQSKNINPVESVIRILHSILDVKEVSSAVKKDIKWAIEIIEKNKLYHLNLDLGNNDKNFINFASSASNDATLWFERDLDDFLKEIHTEVDEDPSKQEEHDEKCKSIIEIPDRKWNRLVKILDTFDQWDFDIFKYYEILGDTTLPHFGLKIFYKYSLLEKFSILDTNLLELLTKIHKSFYDRSVFHCSMYTIQTTYNFYYFVRKGGVMRHLSDLDLMAGLIACLIHDVGHPGVTNSFLISTRHLKAIRYNDRSVLENHHLAIGFKILLDPQNDIFESLSEAQSWNVRQIIIKMVLATDITTHFEQITALRVTKNFPEDTKEDKQALLNILLYATDHSIPCKPTMYYFKWMAEQMEEFYQQGDIERKLGYEITPFFDRTTCNPFLFQRGYIDVIVKPIFSTIVTFMPDIKEDCITNGLDKNREVIESKIATIE